MAPCQRIPALILLWLIAAGPLGADDVSVTAEANRKQIYLGESFILQINVAGAADAEPDLSQIQNARTRSLGKQKISNYSISYVNGQMTRQGFSGLIINYEITPLAAGVFRAGPVSVTVNGKSYTAEAPSLTVTDIEKQDTVILSVASSRETVLVDEPFEITLSVRIKRLAGKFSEVEPLFPDSPPVLTVPWLNPGGVPGLNGPDINQLMNKLLIQNRRPGFAINDYARRPDLFDFSSFMSGGRRPAVFALDRRSVRRDGGDYLEYYLTLSYAPKDEGNYVFGPAVFKGSAPIEIDDTGNARGAAIFAVGPACTVRVIPPPEQGRPACFTGAIGSNLTVKAGLDTSACSVGDPLQLTLELAGQIRFDKMLPPKLALQTNLLENFTVYDNTVQTVKQDAARKFIYTLRPTRAGNLQVPPIEVAYYDALSRGYRTVQTRAIPLVVKQGSEITASQIVVNTNLPPAAATEDDRTRPVAPLRVEAAGAENASLLGSPAWLAAAGAGPGLFFISLIIRFYRAHGARRKAARRRQLAGPRALRRLNAAVKKNDAPPGAAKELCAVMRQYLADRLGIAAAGITPHDARRLLAGAGAPDAPADEFTRLFQHYFDACFLEQAERNDLNADVRRIRTLILDIEQAMRTRKKRKTRVAATFPLLLTIGGLALFACASAPALDASERAFIWNEGHARLAAARTPDDFLRAAQTYRKLVDAGVRNGPLFYNLGTALLQAGQIDPAIEAFERAERYLGAQDDVRHNLAIALARKADSATAEWPWQRLVFFWHFYWPAAAHMMAASIAFFCFWAVLALRPAWPRRRGLLNGVLILAAVIVVLAGSSAAVAWQQEAAAGGFELIRTPAAAT